MARVYMQVYAWAALVATVGGLAAMLAFPPASARVDASGAPFFAPRVLDPATGKPVDLSTLIRHYRGD